MEECDHFWELVLDSLDENPPMWECMKCGETKQDDIPLIDTEIISGANYE
jgi:hypothetical protein